MSSSAYLLVCKRWLRVATPLLYETVVLRSVAQARALAAALNSNPEFARFVLKLRVEGGYGAAVASVLKAARGIKHVCLSLNLTSTDNVKSMYDILFDAVAPTRLVITTDERLSLRSNKQLTHATSTLLHCIKDWSSLRVLTIKEFVLITYPRIFAAVCEAAQVQAIVLPTRSPRSPWVSLLNELAARCKAPVVEVGWPKALRMYPSRTERLAPVTLEKVRFAPAEKEEFDDIKEDLATHSNPFFRPLSNVSNDVRRRIWTLILTAAIESYDAIDHLLRRNLKKTTSHAYDATYVDPLPILILVCKEWKSIAQGIGCKNLVFTSLRCMDDWQAFTMCDEWRNAPSLVRSLQLHLTPSGDDGSRVPANQAVKSLLSSLINLHELDTRYALLPEMTALLPGSLRTLHVGAALRDAVYTLPRFDMLRTLHWECFWTAGFSLAAKAPGVLPSLTSLYVGGLRDKVIIRLLELYTMPQLGSLTLSNHVGGSFSTSPFAIVPGCLADKTLPALRFLEVRGGGAIVDELSEISMPQLVDFSFNACKPVQLAKFLAKNGTKIGYTRQGFAEEGQEAHCIDVVLAHCPEVLSIDVSKCRMPVAPVSPRGSVHMHLREIVCPSIPNLTPLSIVDNKHRVADWSRFADSISGPLFPKMSRIRIATESLWPDTSKNTTRHPLPPVAESLLERGIHVVDALNVGWKPRLTSRKTS